MSSIFESILATPEVTQVLSGNNFVQAMLRFQAALAQAQASAGLIPQAAAQSIVGTCKVDLFDVPKLVRESARSHCLATPLVGSLRETVGLFNPDAVGFVSFDCSSQDLVDSAMALVTREALGLISADLAQAITTLLALAAQHASDPMLARLPQATATVTTFGLQCSQWVAPLLRSQQRLQVAADNALRVQLVGAVGTPVMAQMATELKLKACPHAGPAQRDEWVVLACELGLLTASVGKLVGDIAHLAQFEFGELQTSETCCIVALAAAQRAPQRMATLMASLQQEHQRGVGNWQAGLSEWPALLTSTHAALRAVNQMLATLSVNTQRMLSNLDERRASLPDRQAAECFSPALRQQADDLTRAQISLLTRLNSADAPG